MKNLFFFAFIAAILVMAGSYSRAEDFSGLVSDLGSTTARPDIAGPDQVAMTYWQLVQKRPNFKEMARKSEQYKKAADFEKQSVEAGQASMLENTFDSISFTRPTVVRMVVTLSRYSAKNDGFVVTNLEEQVFFKYSFAGENYAIVPRGLMDHQFMGPIRNEKFALLVDRTVRSNLPLHLMIFIKPDFADPPNTLTEIDGERYHIISGKVSHVALYDANETQQYWGNNSDEFNSAQHEQLMNLKQ